MGCFGDFEDTKKVKSETTSTTSPPAWVSAAGERNYNQARSILDAGFQPYTGEFVAPLSANERSASDMIARLASTTNPYEAESASAARTYGSTPGYKFDFNTVVDENGPLGPMSRYMSPYLAQVLDPTLRQISLSGAQARHGINANATAAGAYGDARHGVVESEQRKNQAVQEGDAVNKGYFDAFNSAMGLRQQDLGRKLQTDTAQAGEDRAYLDRVRTSGIDLTSLDKSGVSRALGLSSALGQTGSIERGVRQAEDDARFAEFMREKGFTQNQIAFLTSILSGTPTEKTTTGTGTQTTSQPNNSGWQMLGSLAGTGMDMAASMAGALLL